MSATKLADLTERLFAIFRHRSFLDMQGLANEVPIFVQTYAPSDEDKMRDETGHLVARLRAVGVGAQRLDLFDLVLDELEESGLLAPLVEDEKTFDKQDLFETLVNYSSPRTHLVPRLAKHMAAEGTQLTFITGSGRVFPFLRTHTILESLQPQMVGHPVVIFFPGEYVQELGGGSSLRLFGSIPSPTIVNPYYRAINLDTYRL